MKTVPAPAYVLALLLTVCFTLTTWLQPVSESLKAHSGQSQSLLNTFMGGAEKLFAGLFFRKADVYFHSGYYPSIFSSARTNEMHIAEQAGAEGPLHEEHEDEASGFLKPPLDWIEALGRHSINTVHTHLDEFGKTAEMLPWLRISADLDPQNIETYTVGAFYLREMGKLDDAEGFLREGLRNNPGNCEIQFELGRIYEENKNDPRHAINLFSLALDNWQKQEGVKDDPDYTLQNKIVSHLALLEQKEGDDTNALAHMELWKAHAPDPSAVQKQIDDLKAKMSRSTEPSR